MSTPRRAIDDIEGIRQYLATKDEPLPLGSGEEKALLLRATLEQLDYEHRTREEKGLIRQYLQGATGYSRAHVERLIAQCRGTRAPAVRAVVTAPTLSGGVRRQLLLGLGALAVIALSGPATNLSSSLLVYPWASGSRTVTFHLATHDAPVTTDILAPRSPARTQAGAQLRQQRRQRLARRRGQEVAVHAPRSTPREATVSPAVDVDVIVSSGALLHATQIALEPLSASGAGPSTKAVATLRRIVDAIGPGQEGEILMIRNGRPIWGSPASVTVLRPSTVQGERGAGRRPPSDGEERRYSSDVSEGRRYGGGGGGGGTTAATTTINGIAIGDADARYVDKDGDTMIGALIISTTGVGLYVSSASGNIIQASTALRSSGSLLVEGTVTGATIGGFGLTDCDTAGSSKLLWDETNKRFSCGTDQGGTGLSIATGDARYVRQSGGTMTGALTISVTGSTNRTLALEALGTISGSHLRAQDVLTSSGTLVWEGAGSGATLTVSGQFDGSGLSDCDTASTSKLLWDTTLKRFSCGTDQNTGGSSNSFGSGNVITIGDARYVNTSGDTMTGALTISVTGGNFSTLGLVVRNTLSGAHLHADGRLSTSGALVIKKYSGTGTGNILVVDTSGLVYDATNKRVGIGTTSPRTALATVGTVSGSALTASNLVSCGTVYTDATGNLTCGGTVIKRKTNDEVVNNSNTLQLDDDLNFLVGASQTWVYRITLAVLMADGTAGWGFAVTAPAASTCQTNIQAVHDSSVTSSQGVSVCGERVVPSTGGAGGVRGTMELFGSIVTGSNAGSGRLMWSQGSAVANDNTVFSGSLLLAFRPVGADLAEVYYARTPLVPGTVVSLDSSLSAGVQASVRAYDSSLMGVVSTKPGLLIGGAEGASEGIMTFVALAGRVPVMVSTENGAIQPGDYLTSSALHPGIAMKATHAGPVIGQAMHGYEGQEVGVVTVFVKNTFFDPQSIGASNGSLSGSGGLQSLSETGTLLEEQVTTISGAHRAPDDAVLLNHGERLSRLESTVGALSGASIPSELTANTLTLDRTLTVSEDARIGGDLSLEGMLRASDLFVPGGLKIDGPTEVSGTLEAGSGSVVHGVLVVEGTLRAEHLELSASGSSLTLGELLVRDALRVIGPVTFEEVATFLKDVRVAGALIVSGRQAGYAVIARGSSSVTVSFGSGSRAIPIVTASPDVPVLYALTKATQTGFTIRLASPAPEDVTFSWTALLTDAPITHAATVFTGATIPAIVPKHPAEESTGASTIPSASSGTVIDVPTLEDAQRPPAIADETAPVSSQEIQLEGHVDEEPVMTPAESPPTEASESPPAASIEEPESSTSQPQPQP